METNQTSPDKKNIVVPVLFIILALTAAVFFIRFAKKKTATPPKPETKMNIRIAYPALGTVISGQVGTVLQNTDTLTKNGLSADITPMNTGKEMKLALVGNQVDVILTSESNFVVLLGQGFKCYAIASLGSDGKMGLVVNEDSGIKNLSDLKNKKNRNTFRHLSPPARSAVGG